MPPAEAQERFTQQVYRADAAQRYPNAAEKLAIFDERSSANKRTQAAQICERFSALFRHALWRHAGEQASLLGLELIGNVALQP